MRWWKQKNDIWNESNQFGRISAIAFGIARSPPEGQFSVVPSGFGNCCKPDVPANRGESPAHARVVAASSAQAFLEFLKRRANVFRQRMMVSPQIIDLDESDPSPG